MNFCWSSFLFCYVQEIQNKLVVWNLFCNVEQCVAYFAINLCSLCCLSFPVQVLRTLKYEKITYHLFANTEEIFNTRNEVLCLLLISYILMFGQTRKALLAIKCTEIFLITISRETASCEILLGSSLLVFLLNFCRRFLSSLVPGTPSHLVLFEVLTVIFLLPRITCSFSCPNMLKCSQIRSIGALLLMWEAKFNFQTKQQIKLLCDLLGLDTLYVSTQ